MGLSAAQKFMEEQRRELDEAKAKWKAAADSFDRTEKAGCSDVEQERRLDAWQDAARDFWRVANAAVVDSDHLRGEDFDLWCEDSIQTAHNMVSGLLRHQENVRHHRTRLNIPAQKYEFSPAVFENLQSVLAWYRPQEARDLKAQYFDSDLPTSGFDRPRELKTNLSGSGARTGTTEMEPSKQGRSAMDIAHTTLLIFGLLAMLCVVSGLFFKAGALALFFFISLLSSACALGCIGVGAFAIYRGATSDTKFKMFGVELSSGSVGLSFMAIGLIIGYFTVTKILDKVVNDVQPISHSAEPLRNG